MTRAVPTTSALRWSNRISTRSSAAEQGARTMSKRIGYLTVAIVAFVTRSAWASSIPIPPRGPQEQYALVVGVDSAGARVTPHLEHIVDLLSSEYGYRHANILAVYNEKATLDGLHAAVGQISSRTGPSDSLFVIVALPTARG